MLCPTLINDLLIEYLRPIEGRQNSRLEAGGPSEALLRQNELSIPVEGEGWWVYMDPRRE